MVGVFWGREWSKREVAGNPRWTGAWGLSAPSDRGPKPKYLKKTASSIAKN